MTDVKPSGGKASPVEALKKKVGPLPLGVWLAAGLAVWWYMRKKQAAAAGPGGTAANGTTATGYGTDPAGNTGYIDPSTGYVYGSAEDVAALQSQGLVGAPATGSSSGTGASGSSGGGDASGGGSPAGGGTTPSGTPTTTPGAPGTGMPGVPTPAAPPASTSKSWKYPAPSGLTATNVSDSGFGLTWQPVTGPGGQHPTTYTVMTSQMNGKKVDQFSSGSTSTKEYGAGGKGLTPGWQYRVDVWANGGPVAPPHATTVVTLKPKGAK